MGSSLIFLLVVLLLAFRRVAARSVSLCPIETVLSHHICLFVLSYIEITLQCNVRQ
jgi:hypothetical protein